MVLDYIRDCRGFGEVLYILASGNSMYLSLSLSLSLYIYIYIYIVLGIRAVQLEGLVTYWLSKWGYKTETFLLTTPIFLEPGKERLRKRSFLPLLSSHMPHFLSSHSFFFFFFLRHW